MPRFINIRVGTGSQVAQAFGLNSLRQDIAYDLAGLDGGLA